jgi:hypothetical protein
MLLCKTIRQIDTNQRHRQSHLQVPADIVRLSPAGGIAPIGIPRSCGAVSIATRHTELETRWLPAELVVSGSMPFPPFPRRYAAHIRGGSQRAGVASDSGRPGGRSASDVARQVHVVSRDDQRQSSEVKAP